MIAIDSNILIQAHRADLPFHARATTCMSDLASSDQPWMIPWPCVHEFLAVVTNLRVFKVPTPLDDAIRQVDLWFESPMLTLGAETSAHWPALTGVLRKSRVVGGTIHDARIAAICLALGVRELWSADRDFVRFGDLRIRNPLAEK